MRDPTHTTTPATVSACTLTLGYTRIQLPSNSPYCLAPLSSSTSAAIVLSCMALVPS